ncbi:MAG: hypothetical protein LUD47_05795 [Clostridia bacterium]|nr:hypothetical protein [Clostridia bacterium]
MSIADIIAIVLIVLFAIIGLCTGITGGIRFFTRGKVWGVIVAIFVSYFVFSCIAGLEGVQNWLDDLIGLTWGYVILAVVTFIVCLIVRFIFVKAFAGISETPHVARKVFDKIFGMVFWVAVLTVLLLIVMQVYYAISGDMSEGISFLNGGFMKLDYLYDTNPMLPFINSVKGETEEIVEGVEDALAAIMSVI